MAEYVENWTDNLAFCSVCKAVFQNIYDANVHEESCPLSVPKAEPPLGMNRCTGKGCGLLVPPPATACWRHVHAEVRCSKCGLSDECCPHGFTNQVKGPYDRETLPDSVAATRFTTEAKKCICPKSFRGPCRCSRSAPEGGAP